MKKRLLSILLLLTIIFTSSIVAFSGPADGPGPITGRPRIATITTPCPDYEVECDIDLEQ